MTYSDLNNLYKNDEFRCIDKDRNSSKFYLLRSISKANTIKNFCKKYNVEEDLDVIFKDDNITTQMIIDFIKEEFIPRDSKQIKSIEKELNKMQYFDWGGSMGNSLEKNIVNNYVKKLNKYDKIEEAIFNAIQNSVYGYTMNSWYNHWSTILIEELFYNNKKILPTVDSVEKIDFFIENIPFDLKVTYFPDELMRSSIEKKLKENYGSKNELTCVKKIAKDLNITIPTDLNNKQLLLFLINVLKESIDEKAKKFLIDVKNMKKEVIEYYKNNPKELMVWLYENQGERRFDAANRFYLVLVDSDNIYESWKLKRNVNLLKQEIDKKLMKFDKNNLNKVNFYWAKDGKEYTAIAELLFIIK